MTLTRLRQMAIGCACVLVIAQCISISADEPDAVKPYQPPVYRIELGGFDSLESDLRPLFDSAIRELWQFFPDYQIEPMVIARSRSGPIVLFDRNDQGELVVKLDTEKTYWAQYSYQFAHEFCHVLCGVRPQPGDQTNRWFEETLCETASLYVVRAMARTWKTSPPFPNWMEFRDAMRSYADEIQGRRVAKYEIYSKGLPAFYLTHQATLEKNPTSRDLNGAMAVILLQLFEEQPTHWEAIRWLKDTPPDEHDSFQTYLRKWHSVAPAKHQPFVRRIANLYGVSMDEPK